MEPKKEVQPIEVQVYRNLVKMKPGEVITVAAQAKKNPALFIEIVKKCIDNKCPVEFSPDYTRIKRLDNVPLKQNVIDYGRNPDDLK